MMDSDRYRNVVMFDENYDTPVLIRKCKTEDEAVRWVEMIGDTFIYAHVDITDADYPLMPAEDRVFYIGRVLDKFGLHPQGEEADETNETQGEEA